MKEIFNIICPIKLQLNILQLEEYKPMRFLNWIIKNFFKRKIQTKKGLVYTSKIKNIILIYILLCVVSLFINIFFFIILATQPYIGLILAVFILKPYEIWNRYKTINMTRNKVLSFKNLEVIGITGSFGKTSTKEIIYQVLKTKYKTLRTPESFNTIFGISKVVDLVLDSSYEIFVCEMAAYKIGEIKTLCNMVPPKYGILTGVTTQHFERFGSLINTIKAKFELVDSITNKNNIIFNLEDENIIGEIKKRKIEIKNQDISAKNIIFNKKETLFDLNINKNNYKVKTALFGYANIKNIILASSMALKLNFSPNELVAAINNLSPFDNRNVLINNGKATIINNTYSSNIQSFKEMIATAKSVKGTKVLVTPGIVELGSLENEVHKNLGSLSQNIFDKVILVGENNRTKSLAKGLEKKYEFINDNRKEYFNKIEELKKVYDWIFLENDVTENY